MSELLHSGEFAFLVMALGVYLGVYSVTGKW